MTINRYEFQLSMKNQTRHAVCKRCLEHEIRVRSYCDANFETPLRVTSVLHRSAPVCVINGSRKFVARIPRKSTHTRQRAIVSVGIPQSG